MNLATLIRDYGTIFMVLASVGIGTYTNISVIDSRVSAVEKKVDEMRGEIRQRDGQIMIEQADQWHKIYTIEAESRVNFEQHNHIDKALDELKTGIKDCEKRLG